MKKDDFSQSHLGWLIDGSTFNQKENTRLLDLLQCYRAELTADPELLGVAHLLVGACFALWRAVFLGDVGGKPDDYYADAEMFLGQVILNNAIAYSQDRNAREWTFGYYLNDAGFRLLRISKKRPDILNFTEDDLGSSSKDIWVFYQSKIRDAICALSQTLKQVRTKSLT